jgi:nucleotide-binding universal stress UspA family protein
MMSTPTRSNTPLFDSILHPTDFSPASERAFAHALALALLGSDRFTLLHVGTVRHSHPDWTRFPGVRGTLERWGLLRPGSPRTAVFEELRLRAQKVVIASRFPALAVIEYVRRDPFDLVVLATEGKGGLAHWLRGSVAESVARGSRTATLFVPVGAARDFVSPADGTFRLRNILVPIDFEPPPNGAIELARRMAVAIGDEAVITLLNVGEPGTQFPVDLGDDNVTSTRYRQQSGHPVEQILKVADETRAELVVMATAGHHGVFDALRGSTTEQVLHAVDCPLLAVPTAR